LPYRGAGDGKLWSSPDDRRAQSAEMTDFRRIFEWFAESADERDVGFNHAITDELLSNWAEVRQRIGAERFDATLGKVRAGRFERRASGAWTQTNGEHELGDFVNLTLEVDAAELSLNVIGWFDPQLEKIERWLRKSVARKFMRTLEEWFLVIFIRKAHVGESGRAVFQGAPGTERQRIAIAGTSPANLAITLAGLRPQLDPGTEKLALHIRRPWSPAELGEMSDLPGAIAAEVERWLDPLEAIRLA
jgi:hypothetical protein